MTKLLQVISRAIRRVKFETILKHHEWYFMPHITNKSCYYLFFPAGIFPSNHACQAAWWMNQARNMHTASNLYIKLVTPGWPFSCNTGIKVTSAELSNPGPYREMHCNAVCTWKLWDLPLLWFVYERNWLDLINLQGF